MTNISTTPPKGTRDWEPAEFAVRKYIFDTWREVCEHHGYQEYLTPLVEYADVYRAKSGEDVGGKELTIFQDRAGRELAIRPEMTPSVTRMVADSYASQPKPIRLFSIANFFRNEKPQRGRNREFWQLNFDVFGSDSLKADIEIIRMGIEIMQQFGASKDQFVVYLNHRQLIESFVTIFLKIEEQNQAQAIRTLDKFDKLSRKDFISALKDLGAKIKDEDLLINFLSRDDAAMQKMLELELVDAPGLAELKQVVNSLTDLGFKEYIRYNPGMVRGFDYYDGTVFEVFDTHPDNNRAMFGGGRYNGLAGIFGKESFPAVGCAPGDETTKLFLEAHNLVPEWLSDRQGYYLPILEESAEAEKARQQVAAQLRSDGETVIMGLEPEKFGKALGNADKLNAQFAILIGENELKAKSYTEKNLETGEQEEIKLDA